MIRGDVLTKERIKRGDVRIEQSDRGGVQFRTLSYIDVLLEADTITEWQAACGRKYQSLSECALYFLGHAKNRLYSDVVGEDESPEEPETGSAEHGAAYEVYSLVGRKLDATDRRVIEDACKTIETKHTHAIYAVWPEHSLMTAFSNLEKAMEAAGKDFSEKLSQPTCLVF